MLHLGVPQRRGTIDKCRSEVQRSFPVTQSLFADVTVMMFDLSVYRPWEIPYLFSPVSGNEELGNPYPCVPSIGMLIRMHGELSPHQPSAGESQGKSAKPERSNILTCWEWLRHNSSQFTETEAHTFPIFTRNTWGRRATGCALNITSRIYHQAVDSMISGFFLA